MNPEKFFEIKIGRSLRQGSIVAIRLLKVVGREY